jgi:hypothetical protein
MGCAGVEEGAEVPAPPVIIAFHRGEALEIGTESPTSQRTVIN